MDKVIALLWGPAGTAAEAFAAQLKATLPPLLKAAGAQHIRLNLEDAISGKGAHLRQSRGPRQHDAVVQFGYSGLRETLPEPICAALSRASERWHAWQVTASHIIANTRHPAQAGERTSGWAQMAFLTLPERLTHAEWRSLWQDRHTAVAIETQANFEYVQNLIERPLSPGAPPYVAIVEECFPEAALTDPFVFFDAVGDPEKFKANLDRMMESCDRFIDRGTIDVIPTGQYNF
jgi:hypothetical protein